jgi:hypothetical protein
MSGLLFGFLQLVIDDPQFDNLDRINCPTCGALSRTNIFLSPQTKKPAPLLTSTTLSDVKLPRFTIQ